jgi:hypothetical protein
VAAVPIGLNWFTPPTIPIKKIIQTFLSVVNLRTNRSLERVVGIKPEEFTDEQNGNPLKLMFLPLNACFYDPYAF